MTGRANAPAPAPRFAVLFGRHRAKEFINFLGTIDDDVPAELDVHVVLDNLSTHKTPAVHRRLVRYPRFHLHFTPTHAS
jgi:hypothetical protein